MAEIKLKFVLTEKEAKDLVWSDVMEEVEDNFTEEFKEKVWEVIKKIRKLEGN